MADDYTAESIQVLTALQAVRKRPGMYIGDTNDGTGMRNLLWAVIAKAIDEHLRGVADRVTVRFDDEWVTVEDNGPGMPIESVETLMTVWNNQTSLHLSRYAMLFLATALSRELELTIERRGRRWVQRYARGGTVGAFEDRGPTTTSGTRFRFAPDFTIFTRRRWKIDETKQRCRELAALLPGLQLAVDDEAYRYASMTDHLRHLAQRDDLLEPLHVRTTHDGIGIELALAWADRGAMHGFVNHFPTPKGAHVDGLRAGVRAMLERRLGRKARRVGDGMLAMVHVTLDDPRFDSQTKDRLRNEEVGEAVRIVVERELARHFEDVPALLDSILQRVS